MIFTCKNFRGMWPVGAAAVIVAGNEAEARQMLLDALLVNGLPQSDDDLATLELVVLDPLTPAVRILVDGNY